MSKKVEKTNIEKKVEQNRPEEKPIQPTLNFEGRGFKTLQEALDFVNTDYFKHLCEADKNEYLQWLNK